MKGEVVLEMFNISNTDFSNLINVSCIPSSSSHLLEYCNLSNVRSKRECNRMIRLNLLYSRFDFYPYLSRLVHTDWPGCFSLVPVKPEEFRSAGNILQNDSCSSIFEMDDRINEL